MNNTDLVTAALALHKQGLHVFPVDHPDQSRCIGAHTTTPCDGTRGKHPACAWGTWAVAATDKMIDQAWARRANLANIGIACGPSNIVVLDEDQAGELDRWCADHGITLPDTYTVTTGRGRHLYFRWDHSAQRIGNSSKAIDGYKIDVRGYGGFAVGEGSRHASGADYVGNGLPFAELPQKVADLLLAGVAQQPNSEPRWEQVNTANPNTDMIAFHERHENLVKYAGRLRKSGIDYSEAEILFRERWLLCEQPEGQIPEAKFHTATCRYPVTWDEAEAKLADVFGRYQAGNGQAQTNTGGQAGGQATTNSQPPWGPMAARLLSASGLANLSAPEPLIDDVLDQGTVALLYGKWGTLKTFIALDWAASVATGRAWQGRATKKRKALYVAAEGAFGYQARVAAWQQGWGIDLPDDDFAVYPDPVNLMKSAEVKALCALVDHFGYGIVVLDTLARCMVGADENSAKDCGVVVDALGQLRRCTPGGLGVVIGVHHSGKDAKTLRGSSVLEGGADTVYFTSLDGAVVTLDREKRRDGPQLDRHRLRLDAVAGSGSGTISAVSGPVSAGDSADKLLSAFVHHFAATGATKAELRLVSGMPPSTFHRAVNALVKRGDLINTGTDKQPFYKTP